MMNPFTIEEVRAFWDSIADDYGPSNEKVGYVHTQRFEKAMEFAKVEPQMRVLNIWSRTGSLVPWLRKIPSLTIDNREVSPKLMAMAEARYPEEEFKLTDLEDLSEFPDHTFDRIISLETLEHAPKPLAFLQELQRVLKPNGILVMSLPPRGAEYLEAIYTFFVHDHGEGPHRFLWPSEVKKLCSEAGLDVQEHHPFFMLPLRNDTLTRLSERVLTALLRPTPLINFGVRHFYVCKRLLSRASSLH